MSEIIVQVEEGKLQGKTGTDYKGRDYFSFQGIPYAKPPVGDLRFKAPVAPEPWEGIRNATEEGSESIGRHLIFQNPVGSEDCLHLNIFTPRLPNGGSALPVMVFIHGGGFVKGSSKAEVHGPQFLVSADIILVTINYRLGILGFLSFEDSSLGVPGNAALKDMVLSLKWIQKNIKSFNGDPQNVTIFGESAGSAAVHLLMLSPMAKGLFHRAIMQSGCAVNPWVSGTRNAKEVAAVLGFHSDNEKEILDYLMSIPGDKFRDAQDKIKDTLNADMIRPFGPIIEKPSNEPSFLTQHPIELMISGNYNKVPLMIGYTSREGMLSEIGIRREHGHMKMFTDFETKIPHFYNLKKGTNLSLKVANMIKEFYYGNKNPTLEDMDSFYLLETDVSFFRGIYICVANMVKTMDHPIYFYRLSVETELNFYKNIGEVKLPGVCHADDLGYLFKTIITPELIPGSLAADSVHRIITLWTNFAKHGDPNPRDKDQLINVQWEPVKPDVYRFLDIGSNLEAGICDDIRRMKVWDDISKLMTPCSKL